MKIGAIGDDFTGSSDIGNTLAHEGLSAGARPRALLSRPWPRRGLDDRQVAELLRQRQTPAISLARRKKPRLRSELRPQFTGTLW